MTNASILDVFAQRAWLTPDAVAVRSQEKAYTFRDLDQISDQLSNLILRNFPQQEIIPVLLDQDLGVIFSILAIFKSQKIYLPLSVDFPKERIEKIVTSLGLKGILTTDTVAGEKGFDRDGVFHAVSFEQYVNFQDAKTWYSGQAGDDTAYILMTSGSTGEPKKVQVSHANLLWILKTMEELYPLQAEDSFLLTTPCTFDVSMHELLAFLYGAGTVVTMSEKQSLTKTRSIGKYVQEEGITHLAMSPSLVSFLIRNDKEFSEKFCSVKFFLLAGEELPASVVVNLRNLVPDARIVNLYGPTETTIYATHYEVTEIEQDMKVPIGFELPGTFIKFLGEDGSLNGEGELLIGGQGVSKGYDQAPELNKEKFITINSQRYYRTGDFGSRMENGAIAFYGRKDDQVQINGIRVELEEIDSFLRKDFAKRNFEFKTLYFDKKLVLFVEAESAQQSHGIQTEIRDRLVDKFPSYMRPKQIVFVEKFPLSINRKLDRAKLIEIFNGMTAGDQGTNVVRDEVDMLSLIERVILNKTGSNIQLKPNDNFIELFALDSLDNLEIVIELERRLSLRLSEDTLNMHPTLGQLAGFLNGKVNEQAGGAHLKNLNTGTTLSPTEQKQRVIDNFLANAYLLTREPHECRDTYYIQKSYYTDQFESVIETKIDVPGHFAAAAVEKAVGQLVKTNVIFQVSLHHDQESLKFKHHLLPVDFSYRLLVVDEVTSEYQEWITALVKEQFLENAPKYFFVYAASTGELYAYVSHYIFDASSVYLLKQKFYDLLNGRPVETNQNDYFDFIAFLNERRNESVMESWHTEHGYSAVPAVKLNEWSGEEAVYYVSFDIDATKSTEELIKWANYVLLSSLLAANNMPAISGSTILNLREFGDANFEQVLGDVHSTVPVVLTEADDYESFSQKFDVVYAEYKKGNNIYNSIYFSYPHIPEQLKKYEYSLDDNLKFSSNYLGVLRKEEIDETIESMQAFRKRLRQFSVTKLYASFFHTDSKLILIPLSNIEFCLKTVQDFGGKVIYVKQ